MLRHGCRSPGARQEAANAPGYFSVETQKDLDGNPVGDTGFGVNNIYLNGSGHDDRMQTQDRMSEKRLRCAWQPFSLTVMRNIT